MKKLINKINKCFQTALVSVDEVDQVDTDAIREATLATVREKYRPYLKIKIALIFALVLLAGFRAQAAEEGDSVEICNGHRTKPVSVRYQYVVIDPETVMRIVTLHEGSQTCEGAGNLLEVGRRPISDYPKTSIRN